MNGFHFLPSRRLALYLCRLFLTRSFAVLAMLAIVLQALDLLGETGNILAVKGNGQADILTYVGLRLPGIVAQFLPFSVLLGTLICFFTLNQNSEVIAMKAAGLSAHQILAPLVLASILVAGVTFVFDDTVVAPASARLKAWKEAGYHHLPPDTGVRTNAWVRDGDDLLRAGTVYTHGGVSVLRDVDDYVRTDARLTAIIHGATGDPLPGGGWRVANATRFDVATAQLQHVGTVMIGRSVAPTGFVIGDVNPDGLGIFALRRAIASLRTAGKRTTPLEATLWHKLAFPLSALLMPLLGSVAAFGLARSGQLIVRVIIGMVLGFAYFVADNFALSMGNIGAYPPFIAAWGPFLLFLLIGETVLIRTEE